MKMNRFENHVLNKRNSRLDSFLQWNLGDYGYVRYYEKCVTMSKGNFLHCHLILTDENLLVTQNPPKTLIHAIPLASIQDIRLVAERHSVVIGVGSDVITSQHIHILSSKPGNASISSLPMSRVNHSSSSSTPVKNVPAKLIAWNRTFDELPVSLKMLYQPNYLIRPDPSGLNGSARKVETFEPLPILIKGSRSGDESDSSDSLKSGDISVISTGINCDTEIPPRASSVLEQNLSSWRGGDASANVMESSTTRPSSVTLGETRTNNRRKRFFKFFPFRKELIAEVKENLVVESSNVPPLISDFHFHLYQAHSLFLNELFLYWNRQQLKFTSELGMKVQSPEDANSPRFKTMFVNTERENDFDPILDKVTALSPTSARLKHKSWRREVFSLLCNFYEEVQTDASIQRSCFQNSQLLMSLLKLANVTTGVLSKAVSSSTSVLDLQFLKEVLSIQLILFDTFKILIQTNTGTGVYVEAEQGITFNRKGNTNWNHIMKSLVKISTLREVSFGKEIDSVISDPLKFGKMAWKKYPEAEVISLLAMKTNVVAALLHEILMLFSYTPGSDHLVQNTLNDTGVKTQFLTEVVTQALGSLIVPQVSPMSPSESLNFFHQIYVVWSLVKSPSSSFAIQFLKDRFYEEFKYFVQESSLDQKIPDEYPIKTKITTLFSGIRTEILQTSTYVGQPRTTFAQKPFAKKSIIPIILNY